MFVVLGIIGWLSDILKSATRLNLQQTELMHIVSYFFRIDIFNYMYLFILEWKIITTNQCIFPLLVFFLFYFAFNVKPQTFSHFLLKNRLVHLFIELG